MFSLLAKTVSQPSLPTRSTSQRSSTAKNSQLILNRTNGAATAAIDGEPTTVIDTGSGNGAATAAIGGEPTTVIDTGSGTVRPQLPLTENRLPSQTLEVEVRKNPPAVGLTATKVNSGNRPQAGYQPPTTGGNPQRKPQSRKSSNPPNPDSDNPPEANQPETKIPTPTTVLSSAHRPRHARRPGRR